MKINNLLRIIKHNGGLRKSFLVHVRTDSLKFGKWMGKDLMGNNYYENNYYFFGRNRWVIYSDCYGYDYDASHVHPAWFRWLHQMTDCIPDTDPFRKTYSWMLPYTENQTGTKKEYYPYTTTLPLIQPWTPKKENASEKKSDN